MSKYHGGKPAIQLGWQKYKKLWEEEQELLGFNVRVIKMLEMLVQIIPFLYAVYFFTSRQDQTRRHQSFPKKRNRNL